MVLHWNTLSSKHLFQQHGKLHPCRAAHLSMKSQEYSPLSWQRVLVCVSMWISVNLYCLCESVMAESWKHTRQNQISTDNQVWKSKYFWWWWRVWHYFPSFSHHRWDKFCKVSTLSSFLIAHAHVRVWTLKKENSTSCFKAPGPTTQEPLVTTSSGLITPESQTTETSGGIITLTLAVNL